MSTHNVWPMMRVGVREFDLVQYLAGQLMQSDDDRFEALKTYFPKAQPQDWRLWQAGQRVQIIKKDEAQGGVLKLGTEVISSKDGSIAGLLGASPGASTAAPIMLDLMQKVFKDKLASAPWQEKLRQIVPSYGTRLNDHPDQLMAEWRDTSQVLQLTPPPDIGDEKPAATPPGVDPIDGKNIDSDPDLNP